MPYEFKAWLCPVASGLPMSPPKVLEALNAKGA